MIDRLQLPALLTPHASCLVFRWLQEADEEDDDRWVMEQVSKGARSVPSASAINSLNLNGRCSSFHRHELHLWCQRSSAPPHGS